MLKRGCWSGRAYWWHWETTKTSCTELVRMTDRSGAYWWLTGRILGSCWALLELILCSLGQVHVDQELLIYEAFAHDSQLGQSNLKVRFKKVGAGPYWWVLGGAGGYWGSQGGVGEA